MTCKIHMRGDYFHGMWICADCYTPLTERPKRYHMGFHDGIIRQEIAWEAEVAVCEGVTFGKFLGWMVSYLRMKTLWTIHKDDARQICLDVLKDMGERYGASDYSWEKEDAKELVREGILAHCDEKVTGAN